MSFIYTEHPKRLLCIILIILLLLGGGGIAAYRYIFADFQLRSNEIISADGNYSMRVPSGWKETEANGDDVLISAQTANGNLYARLSVDRDGTAAGATIEDYLNSCIQQVADHSDDPLVQVTTVTPQQSTMGDNIGYYYELDTVKSGMPIHFWSFVFTSNNGYMHVDVAAEGKEHAEKTETAHNIMSSVHALK